MKYKDLLKEYEDLYNKTKCTGWTKDLRSEFALLQMKTTNPDNCSLLDYGDIDSERAGFLTEGDFLVLFGYRNYIADIVRESGDAPFLTKWSLGSDPAFTNNFYKTITDKDLRDVIKVCRFGDDLDFISEFINILTVFSDLAYDWNSELADKMTEERKTSVSTVWGWLNSYKYWDIDKIYRKDDAVYYSNPIIYNEFDYESLYAVLHVLSVLHNYLKSGCPMLLSIIDQNRLWLRCLEERYRGDLYPGLRENLVDWDSFVPSIWTDIYDFLEKIWKLIKI